MQKSSLIGARLAALALAAVGAAGLAGGGAVAASAAPAEPGYEAFTVLNGGKNLASNSSGIAVTAGGQTNDMRQQWERKVAWNIARKTGFTQPYQIKNFFTGLCLQDVGDGLPVVEQPCVTSPASGSPQLWHEHVLADRVVNGLPFRFEFSRTSGRVLSQAPQFGTFVPVLSSPKASNDLSAAAALQLWWVRPASAT